MNPTASTTPTTPRLAPGRLAIAGAIVAALLFGMVLMSLLQRHHQAETPPPPPLPPLYEVSGDGDAFQRLQLKTSWAGEDRTPPAPPAKPPTPPMLPAPQPLFPAQTQVATVPPLAPVPTPAPTPPTIPPMTTTPAQVRTTQQPAVPAKQIPPTVSTPKEDNDWLFADIKGPSRTRQGGNGDSSQGSRGGANRGHQSQLFPAAQWERPAQPARVIYSSQILNCVLEQEIRTGHDGTVRCRTTETLYDRFGQLEPLVPLHSLILGKVAGANVKAGQTTVPIGVEKVELPDGTDLVLTGKMGSASGISGVPGDVDNRVPQVVLSAMLSTALAIGTRASTGSTQGFQPSLGQEFTADAGQAIQRNGQRIVERSLSLDPIITIPAQTAVTIQLERNVSLQSPPIIVHR